jgi:hypothetical protein
MKHTLLMLVGLALAGCASGYQTFFTRTPGATPEAIAEYRASPAPVQPKLERSDQSPQAINDAYGRHGYAAIGYSSFNSGHNESEAGALKQGTEVGADLVVVLSPKYTGSVTTSIPITTPTSQTSYTSGSATAYGPSGAVTAYGRSTTTTYGSQTNYIPMTINRQDFGAIYFVKRKFVFGAAWRELNDEERQRIQSNSGVVITGIVDDTPAFKSDILTGDILLAIDNLPVGSQEGASRLFQERRGKTVDVKIYRGGTLIHKSVTLAN